MRRDTASLASRWGAPISGERDACFAPTAISQTGGGVRAPSEKNAGAPLTFVGQAFASLRADLAALTCLPVSNAVSAP